MCYNISMLEIINDSGDIRFSKNVINRIVEDAVETCEGRVTVHNFKGKYKSVVSGKEGITYVEIPEGAVITVYVVIKFGTSIRKVCNRMIDYIISNVEEVMGEKPYNVRIVVTGVQSIETAKRNILIESRHEENSGRE